MNIEPTAHHVLIKLHEIKETFEGSKLVRPDNLKKREQAGAQFAEVIDVGPTAWSEYDSPWAKVGDTVVVIRYAGSQWDWDGEEKLYRIINDDEVIAVKK